MTKETETPEEEEPVDGVDPRERSAFARERTKGEFRSGNYLEDRSKDYG